MPISQTLKYEGYPEFTVCHGSPFKVNQSMRSDRDYIDELTATLPTRLTICGHSHCREDYIRNNNRVVNPGSVGLPLGCGKEQAQFMILNGRGGLFEPEFLYLPYDIEKKRIGNGRGKAVFKSAMLVQNDQAYAHDGRRLMCCGHQ